ncbi:GPR1/FUN34/YaaH family transporter [Kutzneria chonburiensis]|uniref:GPR1/FUN34/YaaH family transporter n=1 Tax=Kutzneria chonburiensis TaxID=1483604 RepID=A0ABV6MQ40_9PSEU|nr:GPR1/FUN34/YaaH family transporter [Kutzneria chonburiensis]
MTNNTRVMLRPYASPLPLGFFSFVVGMALIAGVALGWLGKNDLATVGAIMALFVFPLQLMSTIFAVLTRDTAAATALGLYSTSWLTIGTLYTLEPTQQTSKALGLYLAAFTVVLIPLAVGAFFGKALLAAVLTVSAARAALQAAYQLGAPQWTNIASGIAAILLALLGFYAGIVFMIEDFRGGSSLMLRRGPARQALSDAPHDQFSEPPHEPGVRRQL